ncbi:hypothetical protein ABEB36_009075 [Hypothenemus hampei]|uniref:Mab-21-like HhH/H2TH-like domain-containing protein n=1 Tax=Hypothenemus hampei TaxID=57062 RepID=A0ABD1EP18_HYPHA
MGNGTSKRKSNRPSAKKRRQDKIKLNKSVSIDVSDAGMIKRQDTETIEAIKKDLNEHPEIFVLNNVLLCTMFLKNYQDDFFQTTQKLKGPLDKFWEPHLIVEKANKNVIYQPAHGPKKGVAEPLVTRRIYVPLLEYVQVFSLFDDQDDALSSKSRYQVRIEESNRHGFVKLRRLNEEKASSNLKENNSNEDIPVMITSNNSGGSDSDSTATSNVLALGNPHLIKDQTDEGPLEYCFAYRKIKKPDVDIQIEEMDHENLKDEDVYDTVSYLTSRKFMKYFQNRLFKNQVARQLGIVQYEIDNATVDDHVPGKVFCNLRNDIGCCYPVEVVPCLRTSWPLKETQEFLQDRYGKFQWPTQAMVNEIKKMDCALVPKGYSRKKRVKSRDTDLDWEIQFPLAERYLESQLSSQQIKCYLVLLCIYKEYIEPHTKNCGIVPEHFLNLIFWECERDCKSWPEHRLGFRLTRIIRLFSESLSRRHEKNYFIRNKNIFKGISRSRMEFANEAFHRIRQSPVMAIIRAIRNIRNITSSFYPRLDFKQLQDILYKNDWEEVEYIPTNYDNISVSIKSFTKKPKYSDAVRQLNHVKERQLRMKLLEVKDKGKEKNDIFHFYNNINTRRDSCDSIKDDWQCEKRFGRQKKIALLKFFISNYINIAKKSYKISTQRQTLFYAKQASYLTKILEEENQLFAEELAGFHHEIKNLEDKAINGMVSNMDSDGSFDVLNLTSLSEQDEVEEDLSKLDNLVVASERVRVTEYSGPERLHHQLKQNKIHIRNLNEFSDKYNALNIIDT